MIYTSQIQRPDGFQKERADCTVAALAAAAGVPYEVAHAELKAAGRKDRKGFHMRNFMRGKDTVLGRKVYPVSFKRCQVANFVADHQVGCFLVRKSRHCFAVINGQVINTPGAGTPPGARLTNVWEFIQPK